MGDTDGERQIHRATDRSHIHIYTRTQRDSQTERQTEPPTATWLRYR